MTDAHPFPAEQPMAPRLAALLALNHALYTDHDLDVLLHRLLGMVAENLDAEAASLALIDEEHDELVFQVAVGDASQRVECFRLPIGKGIAGWVAQHKQPVRIDDVHTDTRFLGLIDEATGFQTKSLLCVPLEHRGRVLGILEAINKRGGGFTSADESLCAVLANTVAVSLENFQLHQLSRRRVGDAVPTESLNAEEQALIAFQELLSSGAPIAGFITSHRVPTLLRGLADSHLSGKLTLAQNGDDAEVAIDHGDIVAAWLPRRKLVGSAAILETLDWSNGLFRFDAQSIEEPARTTTEPLWLLLARGRERQEQLARHAQEFPAHRRIQGIGAAPRGDAVAADIWPHLPCSVSGILASAPAGRLSVYQCLARLLAAGSLGWAEET